MLIKTNVCNGVTAVSILFVLVRARTRVVKELLHVTPLHNSHPFSSSVPLSKL